MTEEIFNPYKILGAGKHATDKQIKARFIILAKKHHPDHGGDADKFRDIRRAYDLLIDPQKRARYDETGFVDDDPASQKRAEACDTLEQLFISIINQVSPDELPKLNIISKIQEAINQKKEKLEQHAKRMKEHMTQQEKTLALLKRRMTVKKKAKIPNIFIDALAKAVAQMPQQIMQLEKDIAIGDIMLEILENFTYEFDSPRSATVHFGHQMQIMQLRTGTNCTGF